MYIFKNALTSISRNKGRNILIGMIIVIISIATTISLAIRSSANSLISSYKNQYDVIATIGINRENMRGQMQAPPDMSEGQREERNERMGDIFQNVNNMTIEDIERYGDSQYVKEYYYSIHIGVNGKGIENVSMDLGNNNNTPMPQRGNQGQFRNTNSSDFTLIGYSSLSAMEEFVEGQYQISDGAIDSILENKNCVINSELASLNNIQVNDTITLLDPNDETKTLVLTVVGIYEETSNSSEAMNMFTNSANQIITNTNVVNDFASQDEAIQSMTTPTFVLTSQDVVEKFEAELTEKGLSEYLSVSTNLDQIENATNTISNISHFVTLFLIITLVIGGIVLFIINIINIRERKYEIGVLRIIGMKKKRVAFQFMSELMIVSFVALVIGACIGSVSSVPVSNLLLENERNNAIVQREEMNQHFGERKEPRDFGRVNGMIEVEQFESIDAVVNLEVLLKLLAIGVALTIVSSSATMISIQRFSPLTILKERS